MKFIPDDFFQPLHSLRPMVRPATESLRQSVDDSADGGKTCRRIASLLPLQGGLAPKLPGEFLSIAWDQRANLLYASRMGSGTWRLQFH